MAYVLQNIHQRFKDFSLSIDHHHFEGGKIHVITGANGSGKTTLLNLLALIERPQQGAIHLFGKVVDLSTGQNLNHLRRKIGYLMQEPYVFDRSVFDNVGIGLKARGVSRKIIQERVKPLMAALSLSHLASKNARLLSGGEAQRMALARILALQTEVVLLDEPTAHVDRDNVAHIEELVLKTHEERKATFMIASHSPDQAFRFSTHPIIMAGGRVQPPGGTNIFSGFLFEDENKTKQVVLQSGEMICVGQGKAGKAIVSIEPKDIVLSLQRLASSARNQYQGEVTQVREHEGSLLVCVKSKATFCAMITPAAFHELDLKVGKAVWLAFKASAVRVCPGNSGGS